MSRYRVQLQAKAAWCFLIVPFLVFYQFSMTASSICPQYPTCDCHPNADKFDVYCKNVSDISLIKQMLITDFSNRSINKLMLVNCSVTVFPDAVFDNFSILIIQSDCPLNEIESNSLRNIRQLSWVSFSNTTFTVIPSGLLDLTSLKTLDISFGRVTQITDELTNLTSLRYLFIREGQLELLSKDAFVRTPGILYLDLSYNRLQHIDENTFDPLKNLQRIILRGNMLQSIDGLLKNLNPQIIDVFDNNLTSVSQALHDNMWNVQSLNLGKNPIPFLNASIFDNKIRNLQTLDLSSSKYTTLDPNLLKKFRLLREVNFRRNKITAIPAGFFNNLYSLTEVRLSTNNLLSINGTFDGNPNLLQLFLDHNIITNIVNAFRNVPKLSQLYLENNRIGGIYNGDLDDVPRLQSLFLAYNYINRLDSECFAKLQNLEKIEFTRNCFKHFNYSIRHLNSLKYLVSKSGCLEFITDDEMTNLLKLNTVNLVDNKLKSINGAFSRLLSLSYLNIGKNKLTTLSRDTFPANIVLKELYMANGNKWECDCRLLWLIEWLQESGKDVLKDDPHCHSPKRFFSLSLKNLTAQDLIEWPDKCPDPCTCECVSQGRDFYVQAKCSRKQLTTVPEILPDYLGELDLQENLLRNFSLAHPELIQNLQILNLTNNNIETLDLKLPQSLKILTLDGNQLTRVPEGILGNTSLLTLKLSRNPWICDCETMEFRKFLLSAGNTVTDVNETRCADTAGNGVLSNKVIKYLTDKDLCPSKITFYVAIGIASLSVLLLVSSTFLAYSHYHLHLKVWLYSRGLTWVKEEDLDRDKRFDAFLSYTEADYDFAVNTIAVGLENMEPKFNLCIPMRNLSVGGNELVDFMTGIEASKRFIAILSEDYLNDPVRAELFKTAFNKSVEDKVNRLIIIRYKKVPQKTMIDPTLKPVLEATKFLIWEERMFWEKLRYALPKKTKKRYKTMKQTTIGTGVTNSHATAMTEDDNRPLLQAFQ